MEAQISDAQGVLSNQLATLVASGSNDQGAEAEIRNQLASLKQLNQSVGIATGASLIHLRAEVSASVAAAQSAAQQAQAAINGGNASVDGTYASETARIDARMGEIRSRDEARNDVAHSLASRYGVELTAYDEEREELERRRREAISRGDKVAERQADVLLLDNTRNTLLAAGADITDPAERKRHAEIIRQADKDAKEARELLARQIDLDAREHARVAGLTGQKAGDYVRQYSATKMEQTEHLSDLQVKPEENAARTIRFAESRAVLRESLPVTASAAVHDALTPEARAATQQAAAAVTSGFDAFAAGLSIDGTSQIALSTAPDAHEKVEVPLTKNAAQAIRQGRV